MDRPIRSSVHRSGPDILSRSKLERLDLLHELAEWPAMGRVRALSSMANSASFALAAFLGLAVSAVAADVSGDAAKAGSLKAFDRAPIHPPKDTPDAAVKNLAKAKVPAGFTSDIWAAEPLLANPVAFCFDGKGR